jgi:hypothetical protein
VLYCRTVGDVATTIQASAPSSRSQSVEHTASALRQRLFTTPGYLRVGQLALGLLAVLLVVVAITNVNRQQTLAKSYASTGASSVLTAQRVKDAAAGMDAFAARALATKSAVFTVPIDTRETLRPQVVDDLLADRKGSNADFEERRQKMAQRVMLAAQNVVGKDSQAEQQRDVLTLQLATLDYVSQLQSAQDTSQAIDGQGAAQAYDKAVVVMDTTIIPTTENLAGLVKSDFDRTNDKHNSAVSRTVGWTLAVGLVLLIAIIGAQVFLLRRTNRVANPALMIATALTLVFMVLAIKPAQSSRSRLSAADRSFAAVYQMRQIRSTGYVASSQESRTLLLPQQAAAYEAAFANSVEAMTSELRDWTAQHGISPTSEESSTALAAYIGSHTDRAAAAGGDAAKASALLAADTSFNAYLESNQKLIDESKKRFDTQVRSSISPLDGFTTRAIVLLTLIVGLIAVGLQLRIREYR